MVFEVLRGGAVICAAHDCGQTGGYSLEIIHDLKENGYTFRLNGKTWTPEKRDVTKCVETTHDEVEVGQLSLF